jgi:hypothetical protein
VPFGRGREDGGREGKGPEGAPMDGGSGHGDVTRATQVGPRALRLLVMTVMHV